MNILPPALATLYWSQTKMTRKGNLRGVGTWTVVIESVWLEWVGVYDGRASDIRRWLTANCDDERYQISLASAMSSKINAVSFLDEGDAMLFYLAHQ